MQKENKMGVMPVPKLVITMVLSLIGTAVPLAYLSGRLGGLGAVWYSLWVSEVLPVVFSALCTRREFRKKVTPHFAAAEKAED